MGRVLAQRWVALAVLLGSLAACGPATAIEFVAATPEQGAAVLSAQDEFVHVLTPADLSIRLHRAEGGTAADVGAAFARETRPWSDAERTRLAAMAARRQKQIDALEVWLPDTIPLVKATANLESGLPHTRGAAIIMGPSLPTTDQELDELFLHELFHVLSRANPDRHHELYGIIGFVRCRDVTLPSGMAARMFTNPDAPLVQHAARISDVDPSLLATPVLLANPPHFDPARPQIMQYFQIVMLPLHRDAEGHCTPVATPGLTPQQMTQAIYAHAGRNTTYIFHPEELMADNFSQMMMARRDAPDAWVYQRLGTLLGVTPP